LRYAAIDEELDPGDVGAVIESEKQRYPPSITCAALATMDRIIEAHRKCVRSSGYSCDEIAFRGSRRSRLMIVLARNKRSRPTGTSASGRTPNGAETAFARIIKRDHFVQGHAVEMALGTEAQPARLLKRCQLLDGENANEPTAFRIIFAEGGDRVGGAERVLLETMTLPLGATMRSSGLGSGSCSTMPL
jgi:hypothetical protein